MLLGLVAGIIFNPGICKDHIFHFGKTCSSTTTPTVARKSDPRRSQRPQKTDKNKRTKKHVFLDASWARGVQNQTQKASEIVLGTGWALRGLQGHNFGACLPTPPRASLSRFVGLSRTPSTAQRRNKNVGTKKHRTSMPFAFAGHLISAHQTLPGDAGRSQKLGAAMTRACGAPYNKRFAVLSLINFKTNRCAHHDGEN